MADREKCGFYVLRALATAFKPLIEAPPAEAAQDEAEKQSGALNTAQGRVAEDDDDDDPRARINLRAPLKPSAR